MLKYCSCVKVLSRAAHIDSYNPLETYNSNTLRLYTMRYIKFYFNKSSAENKYRTCIQSSQPLRFQSETNMDDIVEIETIKL